MSLSKKQEKELVKYQEMIAKAIQNKENFEEFADNLELGLGDIRELQIPQVITSGDWCVPEKVPELLVQLCRDPNYIHFVCKYILNIDLLPFQLAVLQTLWTKSLPIFIGSRGCSKSFMLAVYALLRMILQQGCKVAVVGASLRQSMVIFNYIQQIYENAPILRDICGFQGPKRDLHIAYFEIGTSRAVFLPLGNGDKIRGQRANVIICDEFSSISKEVFETVVRGFAAVKSEGVYHHVKKAAKDKALKQLNKQSTEIKEVKDSVVKISTSLANNQIILSGTPSYQFNHFYQYYSYYRAIILSGGNKEILKKEFPDVKLSNNVNAEDYAIIRLPWDVVPEGMMDASILTQGQATMDPTIFSLEYAACFAADSEGFYLASSIKEATCPLKDSTGEEILFGAKLVGDKDKIYVLGIDPASEDDNFTMNVIEVNPTYRAVVYQFAINRKGFEELKRDPLVKGLGDINDYNTFCVKHIRDICRRFNIKLICMDSGGGGVSIRESLKDSSKLLDVHDELILDPEDEYSRGLKGKQILNTIEFSKYEWRQQAHHGLRIDILHKKLLFPFYDAAAVEIASLDNKSVGLGVDRLDDCYIEIEQCKQETTLIRHSQTTTGKETWDVPKIIGLDAEEIKKTLKKDRFTSLLLANWAARLVEEELEYAGIKFTGGSVQGLSQEEESFGTAFVGKGAKKMRYLQDNFVTSISASTQGANGRTLYT